MVVHDAICTVNLIEPRTSFSWQPSFKWQSEFFLNVAFDEGECILFWSLCAGLTELDVICFWAIFVWLAIDFMRDREWPGKQTLAWHCELIQKHRQWMSFVTDSLRFRYLLWHQKVVQWWILQERNFANEFRINLDANTTSCNIKFSFFLGFISARGTVVQPELLFIVYGKMSICSILG